MFSASLGVFSLKPAALLFIAILFVFSAGTAPLGIKTPAGEGVPGGYDGPGRDLPEGSPADFGPGGGGGEPAPRTPMTRAGGRLWTVLVYMAADNNLESFALDDMNEMERAGSTDEVALVCQVDRHPSSSGGGYTAAEGDWKDTRRYYIEYDGDKSALNSTRVDDGLGELDMSDPDTLEDFLRWGMTNYSAEHYLVVMWDHGSGILGGGGGRPLRGTAEDEVYRLEVGAGDEREGGRGGAGDGAMGRGGGVRGFNEDWTDANGEMQLWELESVLAAVTDELNGGEPVDVVGFDQCYMGHIETAYQLIDEALFVVASADQEPDVGWDYSLPMKELVDDPFMTPEDLARLITDEYVDKFRSKYTYMTQGSTSLDVLEGAGGQALEYLARTMYLGSWEHSEEIMDARRNTDIIYTDSLDLHDLLENIVKRGVSPAITARAEHMLSLWDSMVIASGGGKKHPDFGGLSVYFPTNGVSSTYTNKVDMGSRHFWEDFLHSMDHPLKFEHDPLPDQEPVGGDVPVTASFQGSGFKTTSLEARYRVSREFQTAHFSAAGNSTYMATFPGLQPGDEVLYYFAVDDNDGREYRYPPLADEEDPETLFSFYHGEDGEPPTIVHEPLADQTSESQGYGVSFLVDDPYGVSEGSATLHYRRAGEAEFTSLDISNSSQRVFGGGGGPSGGDDGAVAVAEDPFAYLALEPAWSFSAQIPPQPFGGMVEYYFTVMDASSGANEGREPAGGGVHSFYVLKHPGPVAVFGPRAGTYGPFFDLLDEEGYLLEDVASPAAGSALDPYRTIIVSGPSGTITGAETGAIGDFVREGGELLVLPDLGAWPAEQVDDGLFLEGLNGLLGDAGFAFEFGTPGSGAVLNRSNPAAGDLDDVDFTGGTLIINRTHIGQEISPLVSASDGEALLAATGRLAAGKVLCVADGIFGPSGPYPGGDGGQDMASNPELALSAFHWLHHNDRPRVVGVGDVAVEPGTEVVLNASACYDPDGRIASYLWTLPGGETVDAPAVHRVFNEKGAHKAVLTLVDGEEGTTEFSFYINVSRAPVVTIDADDTTARTLEKLKFSALGSDPDGTMDRYAWDFGDGSTGKGGTVSHQYQTAGNGTYYVTLTGYDDLGVHSSAVISVAIRNRAPEAMIGPYLTLDGEVILQMEGRFTFLEDEVLVVTTNRTQDRDGAEGELNISWEYSPGEGWDVSEGDNGTLVVSSTVPGTMKAVMTATDGYGDHDNATIYLVVGNRVPLAGAEVLEIDGGKVKFSARATVDSESDMDSLHYRWDFGDGNTGTGHEPTHRYTSTGEYTVMLNVTDDDGDSTNVTFNVIIEKVGPGLRGLLGAGFIVVAAILMIALAASKLRGGKDEAGLKKDGEGPAKKDKGKGPGEGGAKEGAPKGPLDPNKGSGKGGGKKAAPKGSPDPKGAWGTEEKAGQKDAGRKAADKPSEGPK